MLILILILTLTGFSISLYSLINWYIDSKEVTNLEEELEEIAKPTEKEDNENTEIINPPTENQTTDSDYFNYIKMNLLEVDFNELLKKNSDSVGFINVKGFNINYPIVQTTNNSFYLTHAFDKSKNDAGWVYMDYRNDPVNFNQNTIIYAHSRYDKTMFGSLKNILQSSWYTNKENHIIRLSTPTENSMWQIFSAYTIAKESYYITTTFNNSEEYATFLTTLKSRSEVSFSGEVNTSDKILTLSTCKDNFGNRVVMHAKLIKLEKRS